MLADTKADTMTVRIGAIPLAPPREDRVPVELCTVQVIGARGEIWMNGVVPRATWTNILRPVFLIGATTHGIHIDIKEL